MKPHDGEDYVQDRRLVPQSFRSVIYQYASKDMPRGQDSFFTNLDYLAVSTTDASARPWATLLVLAGSDASISYQHKNQLDIRCSLPVDDPFVKAVAAGGVGEGTSSISSSASPSLLFAAVGVDFTNRNRAKVQGTVTSANIQSTPSDPSRVLMNLQLETTEHLGNCPKYITVRNLKHVQRSSPKAVFYKDNNGGGITLDQRCKQVIEKTSSIWMATRHLTNDQESDLGLNHRGGVPGFVRCYDDDDDNSTTIVVPDYSGNRFYQSLGNVQSDKVAGLLFVDFKSGDMLHVTGDADNLFDEEAEAIMPRVSLVTSVRVTAAVLIPGGLDLELAGAETLSPYNPPIRYLADELRAMGQPVPVRGGPAMKDSNEQQQQATLTGIRKWTDDISTFEFRLDKPVSMRPGGYVVLDFSNILNREYSHMSEDNPQRINDDYIRTWTASSAAPYFDPVSKQFHQTDVVYCTIRRTRRGAISRLLHSIQPDKLSSSLEDSKIRFVGTGGNFSPFPSDDDDINEAPPIPSQMVWIAGGIGITPFMAMWDGLVKSKSKTEIVLLFACRGSSDMALLDSFRSSESDNNNGLSIKIEVFDSASSKPDDSSTCPVNVASVHYRRMNTHDVVDRVNDKTAFVCGPTSLNKAATEWLVSAGAASIVTEDFTF